MGFLTGNTNPNFQSANVINPLTAGGTQPGVQGGIDQQQQLANALAAQNGLGNQASVFNQLQNVASGQGPNPAQAMLNQATGQNVAQTGALMAGQRGASQNAGLLARQAGQQGANLQQQAVGQGATLQANQSLGALGQMGGLANQQVANQMGGVGALNSALQGNQGQVLGALGGLNTANVANAGQMNQALAAQAAANAQGQGGALGGLLGGAGAVLAKALPMAAAAAHGGEIPTNAELAKTSLGNTRIPPHLVPVAHLFHGEHLDKFKQGGFVPGQAKVEGDSLKNDDVKAMLSPGEVVIPRSVMESKDPVKGAAQFVAALQKKKGSDNPESDFKEALTRAVKRKSK